MNIFPGFLRFIGGALTIATLIASPVCAGTTFNVTNTNDSGTGSLRQAILDSNATPETPTPNVITFQLPPGPHTICLNSGLIIVNDVTISGPGANLLTVKAQPSFTAFYSPLGGNMAFSGMTVVGGLNGVEISGTVVVNSMVFWCNSLAGLALDRGTSVTVSNSSFGANSTGMILDVGGTATITGSAFDRNSTAISSSGGTTATLINDTIASNGYGVVMDESGTLFVYDSTINGNRSAGIETVSGVTFFLGNTIVALNCGGDLVGGGSLADLGHNLIGNGDGTSFAGLNGVNGDIVGTTARPINPMLGQLGNNGGPTQTEALLRGSPAIDTGNNATIPAGVTTDQRGSGYARIVNQTVDIGAYEYSASSGSGGCPHDSSESDD